MSKPYFSSYWLRRWSTAVRVRDNFTCCVCGERFRYGGNAVQAHHIYQKSDHPERAYDLDNGISVCGRHHQPLIHTTRESYRDWILFCRRQVNFAKNRRYNAETQHKIKRWRPREG